MGDEPNQMNKEISMLTSDSIKKRVSCRTYKNSLLTASDQQKLRDFLRINIQGPFENMVRFELIDLAGKEQEEIRTLATYGFIKGASTFIVGAVARGNLAMEDYGYCMEKNILVATYLGLGTCWLGGTFNRVPQLQELTNGRTRSSLPSPPLDIRKIKNRSWTALSASLRNRVAGRRGRNSFSRETPGVPSPGVLREYMSCPLSV